MWSICARDSPMLHCQSQSCMVAACGERLLMTNKWRSSGHLQVNEAAQCAFVVAVLPVFFSPPAQRTPCTNRHYISMPPTLNLHSTILAAHPLLTCGRFLMLSGCRVNTRNESFAIYIETDNGKVNVEKKGRKQRSNDIATVGIAKFENCVGK